jgi:hypothetical protein
MTATAILKFKESSFLRTLRFFVEHSRTSSHFFTSAAYDSFYGIKKLAVHHGCFHAGILLSVQER